MVADAEVSRVLVITAHPDDVDFVVGGTVPQWTDAGKEVAYCIVTDGDAGGFDPAVPRQEIAGIRRAEQTAAAKTLGVTDLTFLGYPDGRLESTIALRRDLSRVIRRVRPDRVVCPSPERSWERIYASHPDHLACGNAAMCAVYPDARNPFAHPELTAEGLEAWTVAELWVIGHPTTNHWVDTTDFVDRKVAALLCHASQLPDPDALPGRMRAWGQAIAQGGGLPAGRTAESFLVMDAR